MLSSPVHQDTFDDASSLVDGSTISLSSLDTNSIGGSMSLRENYEPSVYQLISNTKSGESLGNTSGVKGRCIFLLKPGVECV